MPWAFGQRVRPVVEGQRDVIGPSGPPQPWQQLRAQRCGLLLCTMTASLVGVGAGVHDPHRSVEIAQGEQPNCWDRLRPYAAQLAFAHA
ncbi:hypothetical protein ACFRQM_25405 [Streptomyces sp. NPDC056831]|uniref:hypothetical protein n=1 Tax=Streptomyces sp. NPDC056831 TaxID=3345954 RepID=UPI0036834EF9